MFEIQFQVGSTFVNSSELIVESEDYLLAVMASMDLIDISSSDSDSDLREIDNYRDESPVRDSAASSSSRVLPPWASSTPDPTSKKLSFLNVNTFLVY